MLSLTPDRPGEIRTTLAYDLPDGVRELNVTLPRDATVDHTDGFAGTDERHYAWDGETPSPTIVFDYRVNRTYGGSRAAPDAIERPPDAIADGASTGDAAATGRNGEPRAANGITGEGYSFVDAGSWAIAPVPPVSVAWSYVGTEPVGLEKSVSVDGEGATGGEMAYLGPMREYTADANGQHFRLVVPAAASMAASPETVLAALGQASGTLAVGARDEEVFYVAAPESVDWGPRGLEYGGSDAWVRADARLDEPTNVWLHEYVHTRQDYKPTTATAWTTEGMADYYAALLSLRQGRIDFRAFSDHLERGTRDAYADAVLADPGTWRRGANYLKGALVYGATDRQIRLAGDRSADAVFARLNADSDRVTQAEFLDAVAAAGSSQTGEFAREYTETRGTPELWSRREHVRAFPEERPIAYEYESATYRATGPFRNRSVDPDATMVTGETLRVDLPVRNDGTAATTYEVLVRHDGSVVARRSGSLAADADATVSIAAPLAEPGTYTLVAGVHAVPFRVEPPAGVEVTGLSLSAATAEPGEQVTARVTVRNPAARPASGTVTVVAGEVRTERRVALDAGATETVTVPVAFDAAGPHVVRVGNRTATVTVEATPTRDPTTSVPVPLRWTTALAALALATALLRRR
ncbi:MAG: hypothetical protein ABEJ74_04740 [Haloferacaceae archaeon]